MEESTLKTIAVIGCGPRGLSAMESLFSKASKKGNLVKVLAFEPFNYPGAGPVYDLEQPDTNWLNVTTRALDVPARKKIAFQDFHIPAFPTFQDWSGYNNKEQDIEEVDSFPLRSELGKYLYNRFLSIAEVLKSLGLFELQKTTVSKLIFNHGMVQVSTEDGGIYETYEAVLCIGHQPTYCDEQMEDWQKQSNDSDKNRLFEMPYPVNVFRKEFEAKEETIGIRGFGLAMIDVCRALSEGVGGTFEVMDEKTRKMVYQPSGKEPKLIVPFSLDGLPMAPKPLNKLIDEHYVVTKEELSHYRKYIDKKIEQATEITSAKFLIEAITPIIANKFIQLGDLALAHGLSTQALETIIEAWLLDECFEHELILSKKLSAKTLLQNFVGMATHSKKVSLDYVIGHVWRHCQPTMYKKLSFTPLADTVMAEIIDLDERLKRYSYGPPIDSLQQLLALSETGLLTLDMVNNPGIEFSNNGWEFLKDGDSILVNMMINSVLDPPKLSMVKSDLVEQIRKGSKVQPLHSDLAIETARNGLIISSERMELPLAVLGRLAKGTLVGVDAIAECFGIRSQYWAEGVLNRLP